MADATVPTLELVKQLGYPDPRGANMTQDKKGPEEESEPEQKQEPENSSGQWENPPRPPHPSGFNPDYWPKY